MGFLFNRQQKTAPKSTQESGTVNVADSALPYIIERSARRKRSIAFFMTPQASLRVVAPTRMSFASIKRIMDLDARETIHGLFRRHQTQPVQSLVFEEGAKLRYLGHECTLRITHDMEQPAQCRLGLHRITINILQENLSPKILQDEIRTEFTLWLKRRARVVFRKRMNIWAACMDVRYKRLVISSPGQRWGSCSADNTIRLNWRLMLAPLPVLDYVVVHELAHCMHKNHGPKFWRCVEKSVPDWREKRRELRLSEPDLLNK